MKRAIRPVLFSALLTLLLFSTACRYVPVSICDVMANPRKYSSREYVTVRGVVVETANLLLVKYYTLKDLKGDCEIVVITNRILPNTGAKLMVKGTLDEAFKLGDHRLLVIREIELN